MSTGAKEILHHLVDELPDSEIQAARRFLEYLRDRGHDPLLQAFLTAPDEDEPVTEAEEQAVAEAREAVARGDIIAWETVRSRILGQP